MPEPLSHVAYILLSQTIIDQATLRLRIPTRTDDLQTVEVVKADGTVSLHGPFGKAIQELLDARLIRLRRQYIDQKRHDAVMVYEPSPDGRQYIEEHHA